MSRRDPFRALLLAAIRLYKRHVSPHKGYGCGYRLQSGRCSCSTLGQRAVARFGAWRGLGVLRNRLAECRVAAEALRARPRSVASRGQAGFIDCDCGVPCDASCVEGACSSAACDWVSCNGFDACDWGDCGWSSDTPKESRQVRRRRRQRARPSPAPRAGEPQEG
jgi:putative component of membrane protein insertase Oxa1/YidC/SpoIIIJ protein YidD